MNIFTKIIRPGLLGDTPLDGNMTFAVKANIGCGYPASASTPSLREWIPKDVCPVVRSLEDSGHHIAAVANMHELAFGITSENSAFGDVENPRKPGYIAGGSSGGSAAAVAMNAVSFALGTDTGGSMRIPAAMCGVVGYRPSTGLYSTKAVLPVSKTTDTVGVFAQHVHTVQKVHKSIVTSYTPENRVLSGVRIGVPRQYYYSVLDGEVSKVTEAALQSLKEAGVELVEADINFNPESMDSVGIIGYEMNDLLPKYLKEQECPVTFEDLCELVENKTFKNVITTASKISVDRYHEFQEQVKEVRAQFHTYFKKNKLDAFVVPTTILPAVERPSPANVQVNGQDFPTFQAYIHNSIPQSLAGVPCISIPSGLSSDGHPIGLELVAPQHEDSNLLNLAAAVQEVFPPLQQLVFEDYKNQRLECGDF